MLTKKRRLSKEEINRVKEEGRLWSTPLFSLLYLKGLDSPSKFAFILSKRVSKKAVERNHAKRILAGATRQLIKKIREGYWIVFLVKKEALKQKRSQVDPIIKKAFIKIGLLKENRENS